VSHVDVRQVPQVLTARRVDCDLAPYPTIGRLVDGLREEPAFLRAAPEQQPDAE
jgi:maleylacetoacetate isomerase